MTNELRPGAVRIGQLIDGDATTPYHAAALVVNDLHHVEVTVPYVSGHPQFAATERWFRRAENPPPTLLFRDADGTVTLTGTRWGGTRGSGHETGTLRPDVTILGQPRRLRDSYRVRSLMSNLDGLTEWSGYRPVAMEDLPRGVRVTIGAESDAVRFRANGFTYTIQENTPWHAQEGSTFTARSEAGLITSTSRRASFDDHLTAQGPVRALLSLLHGQPVRWRRHRVLDDEFPTWMLAGPPREPTWLDVRFRQTAFDSRQLEAKIQNYNLPLASMTQIGTVGLTRWVRRYSDDAFRQAIEPAVEVINQASRFLEPQVMMIAMSLDAMGYWRDRSRARNTPMWVQIERCITEAQLDVHAIGSASAVGKLIANTNNDLKHPDRMTRPDGLRLRLVRDLAMEIMRAQLVDVLPLRAATARRFRGNYELRQAIDAFKANGVAVLARGTFAS